MLTEVTIKNSEKIEDWEYMLRSAIYTTLIGYSDSNKLSIPCKEREIMEKRIIEKFKSKLFHHER